MKYNRLLEYDSSLKLVFPESFDGEIEGVTSVGAFKENHLVFIKSIKFFKKFLDLKENFEFKVGIIIEEAVLQSFSDRDSISKLTNFILTSSNIDNSMCELSKLFYNEVHDESLDFLDGRDAGEVDIDETAKIAENVFIGQNVKIGKNVIIHSNCTILSNTEILDDTILYPTVTVYQRVKIGKRCRIHSNVTIGSDGFGYNFINGVHKKIWHFGGVEIGDDVELGSCSTVDAGTFTPTIIGNGVKIDNGVQVAHNCKLGNAVIMCGQSGLAGSCTLGDYTVLGGKVGIGPDVELGKGCQIAGAGMVTKNWPDGSVLAGHPARPLKDWLRGVLAINKLATNKNR